MRDCSWMSVTCAETDTGGSWQLITNFSAIAPCPSHESQAVAKHIFRHWTRWAGPPDVLVCDGWRAGLGSLGDFHGKTLGVRDSGANHSSLFSVAEGSSRAVNHQPSRKWQARRFLQHQVAGRSAMSVVSYEVAHALNQRAGRLGILTATRVFGQRTKVHGELMEHGEVVPYPKVLDEGDELARRFLIRASAREASEEHAASEAIRRAAATRSRPMKTFKPRTLYFFHRHYPGKRAETALRGRYLGPAALIGPHGRSSWWVKFGRRAYLCATEHLRGVTPDEADCLGIDESRQLDELLKAAQKVPENYVDLTSQPGPSPPAEIPTEPSREPEEPSHDDLTTVWMQVIS